MSYLKFLLICLFLGGFIMITAQKADHSKINPPKSIIKTTTCDCEGAIPIELTKNFVYSFKDSPKGGGLIQEIISATSTDKFAFEQEHNSTWYLLNVNYDGELVFEIHPNDTTNDYDFLLYNYRDTAFCRMLINKEIKPVRSNLSKNNMQSKGITGLSIAATNNFVGKGAGNPYSKTINVKKGDKYMLVLDNVNMDGKGHRVHFNYMKHITINGTVTDFTNQPIETEMTLSDRNNVQLIKSTSSIKTGNYSISFVAREDEDYSLLFYNSNYFPEAVVVHSKNIAGDEIDLKINKTMTGIKLGQIYNLIYFTNDVLLLLNVEKKSIYGLGMLMKKNPNLKIEIQGHATMFDVAKEIKNRKEDSEIAEERAGIVYNELLKMGVSRDRMTKVNFGTDKMIIPKPKTDEEKNKNRRVSIKILSL